MNIVINIITEPLRSGGALAGLIDRIASNQADKIRDKLKSVRCPAHGRGPESVSTPRKCADGYEFTLINCCCVDIKEAALEAIKKGD